MKVFVRRLVNAMTSMSKTKCSTLPTLDLQKDVHPHNLLPYNPISHEFKNTNKPACTCQKKEDSILRANLTDYFVMTDSLTDVQCYNVTAHRYSNVSTAKDDTSLIGFFDSDTAICRFFDTI